jgi:hypothetical protein
MANETLIDDTAKDKQPPTGAVEKAKAEAPRKRAAKFIGIGLAVIAAVAGGIYYLHSRHYESTDDAFIEGDVIQVSPRVSGQMARVYVQDNQHVSGGELIAEIDARDYEARVAEARGHLGDISAKAEGAQSNLALTSTVTDAVLTQAGAAAGAARDQVQILEARAVEDAAATRAAEAGGKLKRSSPLPRRKPAVPPRMPYATGHYMRGMRSQSNSWTARKRWPSLLRRRWREPAKPPKLPRRICRKPGQRRFPHRPPCAKLKSRCCRPKAG